MRLSTCNPLAMVSWLLVVTLANHALAETNTPYRAGTHVEVVTAAGTVRGTLQDSSALEWILVLEANRRQPTALKATAVVVRPEEGDTTLGLRLVPEGSRGGFPFTAAASSAIPGTARGGAPLGESVSSAHFLFGKPKPKDDRHRFTPPGQTGPVDGITMLQRSVFTLGHYDRFKVPAWVAMRWTEQDFDNGVGVSFSRGSFVVDDELPEYARGGTSFDFQESRMERGHMARDDDLESWGFQIMREGMRMSNVVPQRQGRNHKVWGKLENAHKNVVASNSNSIDAVWITSGPVFRNGQAMAQVGNGTGVPHATYKVIAWFDGNQDLHARGYIIEQNDTDENLTNYLFSVADVEEETGLDFFSELTDDVEQALESQQHTSLWGN